MRTLIRPFFKLAKGQKLSKKELFSCLQKAHLSLPSKRRERPRCPRKHLKRMKNLIAPKALKPLQAPAMQKVLTLEQYSSYTSRAYTTQNTNSQIIDTSGIYPRIHFLAGSNSEDVTKSVIYGYCGSITSSFGNREILEMHKSIIGAVKNFRKSSRSDMVVLKLLSTSPEVYPVPEPGWIIVQLCTPNKANIKFNKNKALPIPTINETWICDRRAAGFAVII